MVQTHAPATPATTAAPPELDSHGNCTWCGEHPTIHIHKGTVVPLRDAHRDLVPGYRYADEVA